MDYTEQFHLYVKDGNRLGRRLRKLGSTLGGRGGGAGRIGSVAEPFDPNAFDGDGDGLIQDSSPWERPAAVSAQINPSAVSAEAELIDPKERESATSIQIRPAKNRKERRAQRAASPANVDTPLRELIAEPDLYEEEIDVFIPTPTVLLEEGVSGISLDEQRRRELDKRDNRLPNKTIDMTPDELALTAVPLDNDGENSVDAMTGHPDQYATPADAATARNYIETYNRTQRTQFIPGLTAITKIYEDKYGTGAFNEDVHRNRGLFRERMKELIGDAVPFALLLGTELSINNRESPIVPRPSQRPELADVSQVKFLNEMLSDPNVSFFAKMLFAHILTADTTSEIYNSHGPGQRGIEQYKPELTPIHAFIARRIFPFAIPPNSGDTQQLQDRIAMEKHFLDVIPSESWNTRGMSSAELVEFVQNQYFDWAVKQQTFIDKGITRDGTSGNLPSVEQVSARVEMAREAESISRSMELLFPGQSAFVVAATDERTGNPIAIFKLLPARLSDSYQLGTYMAPMRSHPIFTTDPIMRASLRAAVADLLKANPQVLKLFQRFGVPEFRITHPLQSADYLDIPDDIQVTPSLFADKSKEAMEKRRGLADLLRRAKLFASLGSSETISKQSVLGEPRQWPDFVRRVFGGPQSTGPTRIRDATSSRLLDYFLPGELLVGLDKGNDPSVMFGGNDSQGLGGYYVLGSGVVVLEPSMLVVGAVNPVNTLQDIIDTSERANAAEGMGSGALIFHEWVHYFHDMSLGEVQRILQKKMAALEAELIASGVSQKDAQKQMRKTLRRLQRKLGVEYTDSLADKNQIQPGEPSYEAYQHRRASEVGITLFDKNDPDDPRSSVPIRRRILDFTKFTDYGYTSEEEMEDDFLATHLALQESGYGPGEILYTLAAKTRVPMDLNTVRRERAKAAEASKTSSQPWTRTSYGQSVPEERIPESSIGFFMEQFKNAPFMLNDAMAKLLTRLFMHRDKDGDLVEQHGITTIRRRRRSNRGFSDEYDDTTVDATSTVRAISAEEKRTADGHRQGIRSRGRVGAAESRMMRFDPDERSRLRSGSSNIDIDTDERLYAFDEPITITDSRARARVYSIGNHRFYDNDVPYSQAVGPRRRALSGYLSGRVYVNRNRAHDGDMIRAMSSTQFGMFVDDMPTYDTTSETDRMMLRGIVSGQIADLPITTRNRIEVALRHATNIHSAVQGATPNKRELYRVVKADPLSFVEGMVVGEQIPFPITAFSDVRPPNNAGEVVLRIQRGAKAIDVDDGQFLSQGTFEIVALDNVNGQVVATLKHVETFDPRHDAMRPVDRFSDKPGAMRKFGTPNSRYTPSEQELMTVDLARRTDKAQIEKQMYGLRSTGSTGLGVDMDDELDSLILQDERRTEVARAIIAKMKDRIRQGIQKQTEKRLGSVRESIKQKYGSERPWLADADVLRRFASADVERRRLIVWRVKDKLLTELDKDQKGIPSSVTWEPGVTSVATKSKFFDLQLSPRFNISTLDSLIDNDETLLLTVGQLTSENGRVSLTPEILQGRIKLVLTDEEKETLKSIRDVLAVGSRAYLLDNESGQTINLIKDGDNVDDVTELTITKSLTSRHAADYVLNGPKNKERGRQSEVFSFGGDVYTDLADPEREGRFSRKVRFENGEIMVSHDSMNMDRSIKGTATLLNQHAWQWWQQMPNTRVSLSAADDGPLVWSRHGFSQVNDDKVDYARLIKVVSYIIGATSSNQSTRKRAAESDRDLGFGFNRDTLLQTSVSKDGSLDENLISGQIAESDTRLRERLAVWLALAIQDRESTDTTDRTKRQGSLVLLANLLDARDMSITQREEWKNLFKSFNDESGQFQIQLDGSDIESDFIPSMVIDMDDPFSRRVERQIIANEARDVGERQDLLMPDRRVEDDKEAEFSKFQQRNRSVQPLPQDDDDVSVADNSSNQRISRLSSIAESFESGVDSASRDEATMTLQTRVAREVAGYDALPPLFTLRDAESEMPSAQNYGDATPRINYRDIRTGANTVILVGIPQSGGRQHGVQEMTGTIRNFVRGSRPSEWDSDNLIWKGDMVFTTTPGEYIHRLGNQADDKLLALGVSKPNSKWIRRAELHDIASTLNSILDRLPSLRHSRHNDDRLFSITGQGVFVDDPFRNNARYILDKDVFDSILEEYHPDLSKDAQDSLFSILSSFGDVLSLQASRDEVEARRGDNLYDWLLQLTTEDTSSDSDSRRRQLLATVLGYDFLDETKFGETRTNIVVLNRSRMKMVDESVSALEVSRATKLPVTPRNPRSLRSSGVASNLTSGNDGEPTLLRMYGENVPDPLGLTPAQLHSQKYERILRQDYGIDTPQRPSLRSGGKHDIERAKTKKWRAKREKAREGTPSLRDFEVFKQEMASSVQRHRELTEEIEALDERIAEIEERQMDLSDSNSLSVEADLEFENQLDGLNAQNEALRREKLTIADTVALEVNSFNMAMSDNEENSSAMMAIRNFLDDEVSGNIPLEYRERLEAMHSTLERIGTAAPSVQEMKRRHKILQKMLDDDSDFDLRYDVTRESGYDDTYIEGADLEDFSLDELDEDSYAVNHWVEWVYRAFFDPDYPEWATRSGESNIGNLAETLANFLGQPSEPYRREKTTRGRLEDLINLAVAGITSDERRTWSRSHEDSLRERFNASYEEAIIDATPSSSSEVPSGVPSGVWRKVIASARLAKRTPFEGERDAALATAKRLLGKHRPDLADDDYVMGLRSRGSTGRQLPTIKGVNLRSSEPVTRGASPEVLRTPKGERFHSRLLERLSPYGVKEEDLMPDGKYGKLFSLLFEENSGQSLDLLEQRIRNPNDVVDLDGTDIQPWYDTTSLSDEDMNVMLEILKESAKLAQQMGFSITPIEGHVVKKINGPIVEDVADVLMDEVDVAMIRALGAPTFARLIGIQASYARKLHQLNKMFGAYEAEADGDYVPPTNTGFGRMTSAYRVFLDDAAERARRLNGRAEYFDESGNLVMSIAERKAVPFWQTKGNAETLAIMNDGRPMSPRTLILTLGRTEGGRADTEGWLSHGAANNAIAEAMLEAVGVSHTVTAGRINLDTSPGLQIIKGPESSGTLNAARERLRLARETAEAMEFSPTPAGRHMEEMVRREIQRQETVIDTYERMGRRYVQIIRESGVSEDELAGRVTKLLDTVSTADGQFRNQHPVGENYGASMFEQALFAWLNMRLASNGVPKITDLDNSVSGLHEIGHFILGQAFTRHGEFASNFWSFAVNGPSSWRTFTDIQSGQSGNFDIMTIREATGKKYTPEQSELFKSLRTQTRDVLENLGLVTNQGGRINRGQTLGDVRRMQQGVIDAISADPTIDAVEKEELLIALGKSSVELTNKVEFNNPPYSIRWRQARQADLTDEVLRVLGIPNFDLDETLFEDEYIYTDDAPVGRLTRVGDLYDALIPLDAKDFGWQRTPATAAGLRSSGRIFFGTGREAPGRKINPFGNREEQLRTYPDRITEEMREEQAIEGKKVWRRVNDRLRDFNNSIYYDEDKTRLRALQAYYLDGYIPINELLRAIANPNAPEIEKLLAIQALAEGKVPLDSGFTPDRSVFPRPSSLKKAVTESLDLRSAIDSIDSVFAAAPPLEEEIIVYRGIGPNGFDFLQELAQLGEGTVFTDAGYISTSASLETVSGFESRPYISFTEVGPGITEEDLFDNRVARGEPGSIRGRVQPLLKIVVPEGTRVISPSIQQLHVSSIRPEADPEDEMEILLPRGTKFRVKSITDDIITVEVISAGPDKAIGTGD